MPAIGTYIPKSGNSVVDGLMMGAAWSGATIDYSFKYGDMNKNGIGDFDEGDWKDFHRELLANVESFANVTFQEVAGRGNINFRLDEGGGGESGVPVWGTLDVETAVGINPNVAGSAAVVRLGTFSETWFHELGHALGLKHTHDDVDGFPKLPGVDQPGDQGTTYLNSQINTVMGYTWSFLAEDNPFTREVDYGVAVNAQPGSFGAIDIAALQHLYGARAHNTGDDVYRFNDDVDHNRGYTTIWDTGGSDTIEYTGSSRTKIDLRDASLKNEIGGGGWISTSETLTGGFTVAHGVVIENAKGGGNDDILIGNDVANLLVGAAGNDSFDGRDGDDRLDGGAGDDILDGGFGADSAIYHGAFADYSIRFEGAFTFITGEGVDRLENVERAVFTDGVYDIGQRVFVPTVAPPPSTVLVGGQGGDTLRAGSDAGWTLDGRGGNDTLLGAAGSDRLIGGSGNDRLDGGLGADRMAGGEGNDTYVVDQQGDVVVETARQGYDRVESSISYTLTAHVEQLRLTGDAALSGTGNELDNVLIGNAAANLLSGGRGNDRLDGGAGADRLIGGTGNDYYVVDDRRDVVVELGGEGIDTVASSVSFRLGANVENLTLTGDAFMGIGNASANTLIGNDASNILWGGFGDDVLKGGGGDDLLWGGRGIDVLTGGAGADVFQFLRGDTGSSASKADTIVDFERGDLIDVSDYAFGADTELTFVGNRAFSGTRSEVHFKKSGGSTLVEGDTNADGRADFVIKLAGIHSLGANDFLL